jgi:DHA1 family multidrug resistance protein-like MFS transporter
MGPVWGVLADRYGRKLMVQRAIFGAAVMIGAMGLVRSPEQLFALRIAQGCLTGVVSATTTLVSLMVPVRHLGSALGLMYAAQFAGGALGPLLGGAVADHFGFRAAFAATAGIFVVSGTLVTLFVPEPAREPLPDEARGPRTSTAMGTGARLAEATRTTGGGLLRREVVAVVALAAAVRAANLVPQPVLPLYIAQLGEAPERVATTVGFVLAVSGIAGAASALAVGRLADRYGRGTTLLACLLLAAALSPLQALATAVWHVLVLRTAIGLALGGTAPAVQAVLTELTPPTRRGAAFGLLTTAGAIGNGAGPVLGSAVAAVFGIPAAFVVTAPVFLVSALVVVRLRVARPVAASEAIQP